MDFYTTLKDVKDCVEMAFGRKRNVDLFVFDFDGGFYDN